MDVMNAYADAVDSIASALGTDTERGLSPEEAASRLERFGPNELAERPRPGFLSLLLDQFRSFLVIILLVSALLSLALGEIVDSLAIFAIVILNAVLGVVQESRAEASLTALRKMAAPNARVVRGGTPETIPARELVPGDLVYLEAGNYVPADVRLAITANLKVDESSLTGESVPVDKASAASVAEDAPLGDRRNSAFMGTVVTYGRGQAIVTSTGMRTEIGKIAEMIQSYDEEETPLQVKLEQLGRWLGIASLAICGLVFVIGVARGTSVGVLLADGIGGYLRTYQSVIVELFMTAVSLAIAAVPEGLPAVVTICLALGMQRMIRRHALIRRLQAVETLGSATVIASDKTGTLTQNVMTVTRGWAGGRWLQIEGGGYSPVGAFTREGVPLSPTADPDCSALLLGGLLCNDARLVAENGGQGPYRMVGDPTEGALVVAAAKADLLRDDVERRWPRLAEIPFDSSRKRMTTVHRVPRGVPEGRELPESIHQGHYVAFVKGAPDVILDLSDRILSFGEVRAATADDRRAVLDAVDAMARQALRVLGVAYRPLDSLPDPEGMDLEQDLIFVGLLGMIDPARPEIRQAIEVARGAGLRSVMVTGDYRDTAAAIAGEIGLLREGGRVVTGQELERLSVEDLAAIAEDVDVYARVSPEHKVKIVEALKARGHIVAMTGDGVNDAPALKRASIGVAMGITGTDVAKSTGDMVLTDDNFASIVSAVEEGRTIYSNIRKFVFYLISCNIVEILIVFLSMLGGLPPPLKPIQLLWLNLVTDGAPALALGLEKGDPDVMQRPPRSPLEPIIDWEMRLGTAVQAVVKTGAVLAAYILALARFPDSQEAAQTVAFITLVISELLRAYTSRSEHHSVFAIGLFSNKWMVWATGASLALLLVVVYVPFLQPVFGTVSLGPDEWAVMLALSLTSPIAAELTKVYLRTRARQAGFARP